MPSLARKVLIAAAVDGLFIQPLASKKEQRPSPPVKIRYGDACISPVSRDALPDLSESNTSFEAFGIVGMSMCTCLAVISMCPIQSFLLTIRHRLGHRRPL